MLLVPRPVSPEIGGLFVCQEYFSFTPVSDHIVISRM